MSDSVRPHRRQPTKLPCPWDSPGKNTGVGCHFLLQCMKVKVNSLSCVRLLATPWTAAYQAPPSMGFSRQEYWSGVPLPSPEGSPYKWILYKWFLHEIILIISNEVVTIQLTVGPPAKQGRYKSVPSSYTYLHFLSNNSGPKTPQTQEEPHLQENLPTFPVSL